MNYLKYTTYLNKAIPSKTAQLAKSVENKIRELLINLNEIEDINIKMFLLDNSKPSYNPTYKKLYYSRKPYMINALESINDLKELSKQLPFEIDYDYVRLVVKNKAVCFSKLNRIFKKLTQVKMNYNIYMLNQLELISQLILKSKGNCDKKLDITMFFVAKETIDRLIYNLADHLLNNYCNLNEKYCEYLLILIEELSLYFIDQHVDVKLLESMINSEIDENTSNLLFGFLYTYITKCEISTSEGKEKQACKKNVDII